MGEVSGKQLYKRKSAWSKCLVLHATVSTNLPSSYNICAHFANVRVQCARHNLYIASFH